MASKYKNKETEKLRNTETEKHGNTKTEKPRNAETEKHGNTKKKRQTTGSRWTINLSSTEKMLFTKHLAVLLGSGIPMDDALNTLLEQATGSIKKILSTLLEYVREGKTLAQGFDQFSYIFSPVYVNMVRAGESSGTLKLNLEYLAEHMERQNELKKQLIGALIYPVIVLVGAVGVGIGLVIFILPNITNMFRSLDVELPWSTRFVLWFSVFISNYGREIILLSLIIIITALII
ncbi:MAG: type II secretion system F family protein, partial [Patescibacteria group bacterium]